MSNQFKSPLRMISEGRHMIRGCLLLSVAVAAACEAPWSLPMPPSSEVVGSSSVAARRDALSEYPGAIWVPSPNFSNDRSGFDAIVLHTMQGSYSGTKLWYQSDRSQASSHYLVESHTGEISQMVEEQAVAKHSECYNQRSIGIDHEGYIHDAKVWYTDAMYTASAELTRWVADRHQIPLDRSHIIAHGEVDPSCNSRNNVDPGPGWNWVKYMQLVRGEVPSATVGTVLAQVTHSMTGAPISGAEVVVGNEKYTTDAHGSFLLGLSPGTHTATVSRSTFQTADVQLVASAHTQSNVLVQLQPIAPTTATLRGTVFAFNATNPSDVSVPVSNATVMVGSQSTTTSASGAFELAVPPGVKSLSVTHASYQGATVSAFVGPGQTALVNIGVDVTGSIDRQPPKLSFIAPSHGDSVALSKVRLRGTASDDRGAVSIVQLRVNGSSEPDVAVTNGAFEVDLTLTPGFNEVQIAAQDASGAIGMATAQITFTAGVGGVVHEFGDLSRPIQHAQVKLIRVATDTEEASAFTNSNGEYLLSPANVAGEFRLAAQVMGHVTSVQTINLPSDRLLPLDIGLVAGGSSTVGASLAFIDPEDGAIVNTDTVTIYGEVRGFAVTGVTVNDAAAELLGAGGFAATVSLSNGLNVITAEATGASGESVKGYLTINVVAQNPPLTPVTGRCAAAPDVVWWGAIIFGVRSLLNQRARRCRRRSR